MDVKIDSYVEYVLTTEPEEIKQIIEALTELVYNDNLGSVSLRFGNESSHMEESIEVKFVHAEKAQALADAQQDAEELDAEEEIDQCLNSDDCEISEEDWKAILDALGFELVDDSDDEPEPTQEAPVVEDHSDVTDRYAGQI